MKRILFILLTAAVLPVSSAAADLFPFDALNVPDELLSDAPGDVYFTGGLYYLDGQRDPFNGGSDPQISPYHFIPLNVGYQFWRGFTAGVQITLFNLESRSPLPDDYGDVWVKAKYTKRVNRFSLGGRVAGKFGGLQSVSYNYNESAKSFDLTLFGGIELTERFSAEFAAGYRFVGTTEDTYDDLRNMLHVSGGPTITYSDSFKLGVPVTYYGQSTYLELSDEHGRIFLGELKYRTVSIGPRAAYTFGGRFPSTVTFRADLVIDTENVALGTALSYPRDYYVGGGYSVIAPF